MSRTWIVIPATSLCQVVPFQATPTGPVSYIATDLVGFVKFDSTNRLFQGSIVRCVRLNGILNLGWIWFNFKVQVHSQASNYIGSRHLYRYICCQECVKFLGSSR